MSYTPDLTQTEWWHEVSLAYRKSLPETFTAILVGWLGDTVPTTGIVSAEILEKLAWAYENRDIDQGWLGEHECEICHAHADHGEILIMGAKKMYVAPKMILHYIKAHGYQPPQEFIDAVDQLPAPSNFNRKADQ